MASKYDLDKFYTIESVSKKLINEMDLSLYKTIIEPSAGNGSFSKHIKNCISYDIKPDGDDIIQEDFLKLDLSDKEKPLLIIGNPPFGRNGRLALLFIKHSALFANTIAFILPKSFKKESLYYKIPLNFWKIREIELSDKSFIYKRQIVGIPCVFQVYEKKDILRVKPKVKKSVNFQFVKKEESNVSIRRVGVYAGKSFLDIEKSKSSHYFIKTENPKDFVDNVNKIKWEHNNTVGPRSISKPELIKAIDDIYRGVD